MLIGGRKMENYLYTLFPFSDQNKDEVLNEINMIVKSNAIGIPLLAVIQGIVAVIGYFIFQTPDPLLFGFLTCIATIIPIVGTALVWVPLAAYMALNGDWVHALGLAIYALLVITNASVRWQLSERGLPMDEALIRLQEEELQRTGRYYKHICFLCVPLLCVSCYLYGLRPLLLCGFAVLMGNLCDRLISLLRRRVYQAGDYSNESFALVITLLMPATVDWYVLAAAILAGALIGKEVFGGYGSYPFHPAAVGYAVAAVSWPEQVFRYPAPYANIPLWDASGVATSSTISDTLRSGGLINISALSLVLGEYAAPMGTGAAIVLAACGLFLWMQKDVRLSASLSFLITAGLIVFFFPRQLGLTEGTAFTAGLVFRLRCVRDEMLTGAMLFSAVFLLNEPYTCAHHRRGRILYGAMVGAFTMGFRYFGVYETGVCFAILAVNSISGWLDRTEVRLHELIKSGRYFKEKKTGKGDAE